MGKRLSSTLLCILLFTFYFTKTASAAQLQISSFFSLLTKEIIAYTAIGSNKNHVLAARTAALVIQPSLRATLQSISQPASQLSSVSAYILNGVNQYRASLGLSSIQASTQTCAFAQIRAQEISHGFNHSGFYNRVNNHTLPYTFWAHATENIAQAPNYQEVVTLWKNSPEHAANMRDNTPYVCVGQYGSYY